MYAFDSHFWLQERVHSSESLQFKCTRSSCKCSNRFCVRAIYTHKWSCFAWKTATANLVWYCGRSWKAEQSDEAEIIMEFDCKTSSTWWSCDDWKGNAFTHKPSGEKNGRHCWTTFCPTICAGTCYIHHATQSCSALDRHSASATIRNNDERVQIVKTVADGPTGPMNAEAKTDFKKNVGDGERRCTNRSGVPGDPEGDGRRGATRAMRRNEESRIPKARCGESAAAVCTRPIHRARHAVKCCLIPGVTVNKKKRLRKELCVEGSFTAGRAGCKDTAKKCTTIKRRRPTRRTRSSWGTKQLETNTSRGTGVLQKSRLTWCSVPAPAPRLQKNKSKDRKTKSSRRWSRYSHKQKFTKLRGTSKPDAWNRKGLPNCGAL